MSGGVLYKNLFSKILQNSQENTCVGVSLWKKRLWRTCFLLNFAKFLRIPFFYRTAVFSSASFQLQRLIPSTALYWNSRPLGRYYNPHGSIYYACITKEYSSNIANFRDILQEVFWVSFFLLSLYQHHHVAICNKLQ